MFYEERESRLSENFYKVRISSFQRPNPSISSSLQYKDGWVGGNVPQDSFYFFLHLHVCWHNDSLLAYIRKLFIIMSNSISGANMDNLCRILILLCKNMHLT